jgi:hypothetical protein
MSLSFAGLDVSHGGTPNQSILRLISETETVVFRTAVLLLITTPLMSQATPSDTTSSHHITRSNVVMAAVSSVAIGSDWLTTLQNVRLSQQRGVQSFEINPFLGPHPSIGRVNTVFTVAAIANLAVGGGFAEPEP